METTLFGNRWKCLVTTYIFCSTLFTISLLLSAFFPLTHPSNSTASPSDIPTVINGIKLNTETIYKPSAQKIVFMVIDALRWDFVTNSDTNSMPWTTASISNNSACLIQARAQAPTVTMPRIKSMMTGAVSSFIDVILNFGATSVTTDSVLHQAKNHGHKMIFYGDDTWIKLFPTIFDRHEGTTSFFVSDFTEVDANVTRHIDEELEINDDWSIMILHYLGLDHIGHTFGPRSPLVPLKLKEMDEVIGKILKRIDRWNNDGIPSILIVCGDHGMKNSGGHGGATPEETLVPLLVFGDSCPGDVSQIEQVDIATTLSIILGIPIPQSNLGSISMDIIGDLPDAHQLFLLHYNAKHMFQHFRKLSEFESSEIYDNYYKTIKLHTEWLIGKNRHKPESQLEFIIKLYDKVLKGMKEILIKSAVKYDRTIMTITIVMILQAFFIISKKSWKLALSIKWFFYWWTIGVSLWLSLNHFLYNENNEVYFELRDFWIMTIVFVFFTINCCLCRPIHDIIPSSLSHCLEDSKIIFPAAMVLHAVSLSSSSFVEEEHQTWYFFWVTLLTCLLSLEIGRTYQNYRDRLSSDNIIRVFKVLILMTQHRILRKLNSTGNKYAHLPDIGGWMKDEESHLAMSFAVGVSLGLLVLIGFISEEKRFRRVTLGFHVILAVCVYSRHAADNSVINFTSIHRDSKGIYEVRAFWMVSGIFLLHCIRSGIWSYRNERPKFLQRIVFSVIQVWVLVSTLLHRAHDVILVPMELITIFVIYELMESRDNGILVYVSYWVGNVFYFYQGNSNSLATVDVAAGYVGLQAYWPLIAKIYLCVNTYSATILAYLMILYKNTRDRQGFDIFSINRVYSIMRIFPFAVYTIIVMIHRYHLFIWTIFSPKLLYEATYTAVLFFVMFVMQLPFLLTE
ncbi:GPI ethanolamine phosphate transferase 2 [Fopius arisanus]|uniref:GPI ethanolamine phosphate transferase 2 n=2 Tax=Fopius arisanus TaxID=64838 RepID=A0A9R1TF62_9HYME|nr:PREDICTED: GPI ethanolamine phosphate transferase 2 [Fopius arisanus]